MRYWRAAQLIVFVLVLSRCPLSADYLDAIENKVEGALSSSSTSAVGDLHANSQLLAQLGRLGQQKATSSAIRSYAKQLAASGQRADEAVVSTAKQQGFPLPSAASLTQPVIDQLKSLSGAAFNRGFLEQAVQSQAKSLALLKSLDQSSNGLLSGLAQKLLPSAMSNLSKAKSLLSRLTAV